MTEGRASIECPECGADSPPGSKFCESCGLLLASAAKARRPARRRKPAPDKTERIEIERKLRKARSVLKSMRWLYGVLAVGSALYLTVVLVLPFDLSMVVVVLAAQTLLLTAGAMFLYVAPLAFALLLACLITVKVIVQIAWGGGVSLGHLADVFVAFCLWCAVPIVAGVAKLQKEFPDLVDTEKLKRRRRFDDAPTSAALAHAESRRADTRRAQLRTFAIVAGAVVISLGVAVSIAFAMREEPAEPEDMRSYTAAELATIDAKLGPAIARFGNAWMTDDKEAVSQMFTEVRFIRYWPKLERAFERNGWTEDLPEIDTDYDHEERPGGSPDRQDVWFPLRPQGTMKTSWTWQDERWQLMRITFAGHR